MTNREKVISSINHKQPDKIPYNILFTKRMYDIMTKFYKDEEYTSKIGNSLFYLRTEPKNQLPSENSHIFIDQFGVEWNRSIDKDIGVVSNQLITTGNLNNYQFPDPNDPSRFKDYDELIKNNEDKFILANIGFSFFERAWTLYGMENVLSDMVSNKRFIINLFERIIDFNLKLIEQVCIYKIDGVMFGDDWGQQTGLIMGPKLWRELIKPGIRKMYEKVKSKGKYVFIHSCGKVDEIFPDLIECGVDVFNPFQPEVIDVFQIKKKFGSHLSFYGGISTQKTLPFGSVTQIRDEVKKLLDLVGENGGYIAAPSHDIPFDAKPENISAMIDVLQTQ